MFGFRRRLENLPVRRQDNKRRQTQSRRHLLLETLEDRRLLAAVWVDDDYTAETLGWGVDGFATIQAGINAVASGGTVYVPAGTYTESLTANKSVDIRGPNTGFPRTTGKPGGGSSHPRRPRIPRT